MRTALAATWLWVVVAGLAFIWSGCGEQPAYTTRHGLDVYYDATEVDYDVVLQSDVELVTQALIEARGAGANAFEGDSVTFVGSYVQCGDHGMRGGCHHSSGNVEVTTVGGCVAWTALAHELGHELEDELEGGQPDHRDPTYWHSATGAVISAKFAAGRQLCYEWTLDQQLHGVQYEGL